MSRQCQAPKKLKIQGFLFEIWEHFKIARVNETPNSHEEIIRERLITANRCYFGLITLFKLKLFSRTSKITLYKQSSN